MTTTPKIAGLSDLEGTGITDELAEKYWDKLGSQHVAVVTYAVAERSEAAGGEKRGVKLVLVDVEPATTPEITAHMRAFVRALWRRRNPKQLTIDDNADELEPTVDQVLDRGRALLAGATVTDNGDGTKTLEINVDSS